MNLSSHSRLVVLDDNSVFVDLVEITLQEIGFKCIKTSNSSDNFMKFVREYQIDVAFIDVNLPGADGLALLSWVKQIQPHAKVVMFSGNTHTEKIIEAKQLGADSFLSKFQLDKNIRDLLNQWQVNYPLVQA